MFLTAILRRKQAARLFTIAFFMFFSDINNKNGTHTKDITIMMTLPQRHIFLSKTLINQLKVKPVL